MRGGDPAGGGRKEVQEAGKSLFTSQRRCCGSSRRVDKREEGESNSEKGKRGASSTEKLN